MKSPSFNAYPNNWLASARIAAMLPEQEGAYWRLLCYQWNSEDQTIPDDDTALASMSRLDSRWETMGGKVKACFHPCSEGKLRNERLYHEYQRIDKLRLKRSAGGKKGMAHRYSTDLQDSNNSVISKIGVSYNREQGVGNREQGVDNREKKNPPSPPRGKARENQKVAANSPLMDRIGAWFNRRPATLWTKAEASALAAAEPTEEDLAVVEWRYSQGRQKDPYLRQSVITMLNNWRSEVDRAEARKLSNEGAPKHRGTYEDIPIKRLSFE